MYNSPKIKTYNCKTHEITELLSKLQTITKNVLNQVFDIITLYNIKPQQESNGLENFIKETVFSNRKTVQLYFLLHILRLDVVCVIIFLCERGMQ